MKKAPKTIAFRRKREQRTNYKTRQSLLLSGKFRLVFRSSNRSITAQLIKFDVKRDQVLVAVNSSALKKLGWNYSAKNTPAAYLTGLLLGIKAKEKGYEEAILDLGPKRILQKGKVFAFLKGALDGGLKIPHSDESIFPSEDRISGKHIEEYSAKLSPEERGKIFSEYLKNNAPLEKMSEQFDKVKAEIQK